MFAELITDKAVSLDFHYDKDLVADIKELPDTRWHPASRKWRTKKTVPAYDKLQGMGFIMGAKFTAWYESVNQIHNVKIPTHLDPRLYEYQQKGVGWLYEKGGRGLIGDDMGLGKTAQVLQYLWRFRDNGIILIVCPSSMKGVWKREVQNWTGFDCSICHGKKKKEIEGDSNQIFIINYDIVDAWVDRFHKNISTIVLDEAHYIKRTSTKHKKGAKRADACKKLAGDCERVIALTGTPIPNKPEDIYTVVELVQYGLFQNRFEFRKRYCGMYHNGYGYVNGDPTNIDELFEKLQSIMLRRLKKDVLTELPDKRRIVVPMILEDRAEYDTVESNFIKWLSDKGKRVKRVNALTKIEYLKQVCVESKLNFCVEWIEDYLEQNDAVVIFCAHKKTVAVLRDRLGKHGVSVVDGSTKDRDAEVYNFMQGENSVFIGNIQAAGTGLTLTKAHATVFVELGWTSGEHDQCEDRVNRIGQESDKIEAYYLVAEDTIEERIAELLDSKRKMIDGIVDGIETEDSDLLAELLKMYRTA